MSKRLMQSRPRLRVPGSESWHGGHPVDIAGQRFGKLVAIKILRRGSKRGYIWQVQCDCGSFTEAMVTDMTSGNKKSCGCLLLNRTPSPGIAHEGRVLSYVTWAKEHGLNPATLYARLNRGWTMDEALTTKPQERRK